MASTSCQEEVLGEQSDALRDTPQPNLPISYSNADLYSPSPTTH